MNNSVRVALQMLQRFSRLRNAQPLPTVGRPITTTDSKSKRRRASDAAVVTRDQARAALESGISNQALLKQDLQALDNALQKEAWYELGIRRFDTVRLFFSPEAQQILKTLLGQ